MNLILVLPDELEADGTVRLTGRRARHVHDVHRARVGDELVVGLRNGATGRGTVLAVSADEVRLAVELVGEPPPPSGVDLLLAMPRPKVLRRALQAAASLGAKRIVLVNAARVEKSYFDTPFLQPEEIERNLVLGLEQARDTLLPELLVRPRFRPLVEDELDTLWPSDSFGRLLAHPADAPALGAPDAPRVGPRSVVAIGPEGGWVPFETDLLEERGFARFTLGPRVLRVETAVAFAFGQLLLSRALQSGR
ncbi:MAG: 16S rRNA (uracil(1498)-N(3))-methyltransferase [Thermoanaerobaculia bacterium]|nr:16S rRNA (uracil(1498)-N(3))-methyltransferase [Thermoanaerobaculia bacterium]